MTPFHCELISLLNLYSREIKSNTPDHILAEYLMSCLDAFDVATRTRDKWFAIQPEPAKAHQYITDGGMVDPGYPPLYNQEQVNEQIADAIKAEHESLKPAPRPDDWVPPTDPPPPYGTRRPEDME